MEVLGGLWCHESVRTVDARYHEGVLKSEKLLALGNGERVGLIVVRRPDLRRWDLERLAKGAEGLILEEQGLAEWADALDAEDRR